MELILERHELLDLGTISAGQQLTCRAGTCWLTLSGDMHDYILRPGQQFTSRQRGHLLVTAMEECRIAIGQQASGKSAASFWPWLNNEVSCEGRGRQATASE